MFSSPHTPQAWVKQHSKWGLLPPQREGFGLLLTIVTSISAVAIVILIIADMWPVAGPLLLVFGVLNLISIKQTNEWIRSHPDAPTYTETLKI